MANHTNVVETYKQCMQDYNKTNEKHKTAVMAMILHAADVGNPAYKFDLATTWSLRIIKEFND